MATGGMGWTPDWVQEALLEHITGTTPFAAPASHWLALGTGAPAETDRTSWASELSGSGYQRQAIEFSPPRPAATCCIGPNTWRRWKVRRRW